MRQLEDTEKMKILLNDFYSKLKTTSLLIVFLVATFNLVSFKTGNQILKVDYFGEILLPEELEIQAGTFKELNDGYIKTILGDRENHQSLVFQQKGLNSSDLNSFKTYARVLIDTYKGEKGTHKLLSEKNNLTKDDIDFYNNNFASQVQNLWPNAKQKLISSNETTIDKIGKKYCTKHTYIRQLESSTPVLVEVYRVQNNDRVHLISFSYRTKAETQWKPIMDKVLKSIKITKF